MIYQKIGKEMIKQNYDILGIGNAVTDILVEVDYSFLKKNLAEILINEIRPVGTEIQKLLDNKDYLKNTLKEGSKKANIIAEENLKNIRDIVGLI